MNRIYCLIIFLLALASCKKKSDFPNNVPDCIKQAIQEQSTNQSFYLGSVDECSFKNKTVYIFSPTSNIADGMSGVVDAQCNSICSLGGIAGIIMCDGSKFSDSAKFIRNIWHK